MKLIPSKIINSFKEEVGSVEYKELIDEATEEAKEALEELEEYAGKVSFSHKILSSENVTGDDLKELKEFYDDEFDIKVSAAKTVKVQTTVKAKKLDLKESYEEEIPVIKVGRSWYLDVYSLGYSSIYSLF